MSIKVTVYNVRAFDEKEMFIRYGSKLGLELIFCPDAPNMENASLAIGSECINILTSKMTRELIKQFAEYGVKYIITRTMGYDHIDSAAAKEFDIKIGNTPYGSGGVADYTVMLILMSIRKGKRILEREAIQDYSLKGLQGKELKDMTVGIIGTGRIGCTVIKDLSGFGCKLIAFDKIENEEAKQYASYVKLETLWKEADIITFHTPLTEENIHMVNRETIDKMKDGVILINTARGGLFDSLALIDGIESGKIGAAGLDVVENEFELYYYDHKADVLDNHTLAILRSYPNVTVTHHMAFYTDNYVTTVVRDSLTSCKRYATGDKNPWEVQ